MLGRIANVWIQLRRVWRPALTICALFLSLSLGACKHWDPVAEKVIEPAPTSPRQTAQPQSAPQAHNLAARSN